MEECLTKPYESDAKQHDHVSTENSEPYITVHPVADLPIPYGIVSKH